MRHGAALLAAVLMTSGCTTYGGARRVTEVGRYMTLGGLAGVLGFGAVAVAMGGGGDGGLCSGGASCVGAMGMAAVSGMTFGAGLWTMLVGGLGMLALPREQSEQPAGEPSGPAAPSRDFAKNRDVAWKLTQIAASAARQDDCPTAAARAAEVRELDIEFYDRVVVNDVAIARCLRSCASEPSTCGHRAEGSPAGSPMSAP